MEPVQIIGIDKVEDDLEKGTINKLVNEYHGKIQRSLKNITSITLHVKAHTKGGKAKKWDIRVKAIAPTRVFEAQESDWDLARTLHKVFRNLIREIQHTFHSDNQRPR
jgi:hypothetical protein